MSDNQTLQRAQIVNELLRAHDVHTDDVSASTEKGEITITLDAAHVEHDPEDDSSPIDPAKVGGGTVKGSE